jgi:FixJ family two-component response regulator
MTNVSIRKALKRLIESIGLAAHDYDSAQQLMVKRCELHLLPVF